jgi:hypothetical protein
VNNALLFETTVTTLPAIGKMVTTVIALTVTESTVTTEITCSQPCENADNDSIDRLAELAFLFSELGQRSVCNG